MAQNHISLRAQLGVEETTPSRTSVPRHQYDTSALIPLSARAYAFSRSSSGLPQFESDSATSALISSSECETTSTSGNAANRRSTRVSARNWHTSMAGNQTILTEASFAVTQDRLVQAITQVHPYEPHWEKLLDINLSGFGLESVTKMKEYLPALVKLNLCVAHTPPLSPQLLALMYQLTGTIIGLRT